MAIVRVQSKSGSAVASSAVVTFDSTPGSANLMVATVYSNVSDETEIVITGWTKAVSETSQGLTVKILYKVVSGDAAAITCSTTTGTTVHLHIFEYSGTATSSIVDKTATGNSGASSVTSLSTGTTATTTVANQVLVGSALTADPTTDNSWTNSFTNVERTTRLMTADRIVAALAAYETTVTWTTSAVASAALAGFKMNDAVPGGFLFIST